MFTDSTNSMNMPWVNSPVFNSILNNLEISDEQRELAEKFNKDGYVVVDLGLSGQEIETLKKEVLDSEHKQQEDFYHYSDSPRVFEAWRKCKSVANMALHPKIIETLEFLYGRHAFPFQTINFMKGSNQPIHSDAIHFHTVPQLWVAAAWVAFEDMDDTNGTLSYYPGSHKMPVYDFKSLNLEPTVYGEQAENYEKYEHFIREMIESNNLDRSLFTAKKGEALIWSANLLHGGSEIKDKNRTRWSQATHYYFEGCDYYYAPMFSDPFEGSYAEKDIENKNIRKRLKTT